MNRLSSVGLLAVVLLASCIPMSKQPLYTANDLVFEEALVGDWREPSKTEMKELQTLKKGEAGSYDYFIASQPDKLQIMRLLKLGDHYFIDSVEANKTDRHMFFKIGIVGQQARVHLMTEDWLTSLVKKDPKVVAHEIDTRREKNAAGEEVTKEFAVLTAPTKDLRTFVLRHVGDPQAFGGTITYEAQQKLPVTDSGLFGKKQRTFEYWFEYRDAMRRLEKDQVSDLVVAATVATDHLKGLGRDGVDEEAVAVVSLATKDLERITELVRKGAAAEKEIGELLTRSRNLAKKTATTLAERYKMGFRGLD